MLKFINDEGKLRYVLLDNDTQPREISTLTKKALKDLGIILDDESNDMETIKKKVKPSGNSQDDIKYLIGR